jgi:hypothetical protein
MALDSTAYGLGTMEISRYGGLYLGRCRNIRPNSGFGDYSLGALGILSSGVGQDLGRDAYADVAQSLRCRGCIRYRRSVEETAHLALDLVFVCLHGAALPTIPREKRRTGDGFCLGRAQVHGGMHLCTSSCKTCCPTNDASPCRNVLHNDRRLGAASSYPRTTVRGPCLRAWESQSCSSSSR